MDDISQLLANNQAWALEMTAEDPTFFQRLANQQSPQYLWIGCADSRVPATQLVNVLPGEMFVHRNVANIVVHSDLNCLAVIQFAVEVLQVKHIIVCGHYSCGGIEAAYANRTLGLIDNWLRHVQDVRNKHAVALSGCGDVPQQLQRLVELNVIEQVINVCQTTIVQTAWQHGQNLTVHGWVYGVGDGQLRDLHMTVASADQLAPRYQEALAELF